MEALSVASCDAADSSSARPPLASASVLFSLQFYVDRVSLTSVCASPEPENTLLVGFQLLQYEIVLFDASLAASEAANVPSKGSVTRLKHGKSCLFEADPQELVHDIQQDAEAPLTLLLLLQEHGRARLRAFAAVPLYLHVGLLDDDVVSSRLLRVCEWANFSGSWELRDHRNDLVGHVTGAVTLSCLGKALAPHLTKALRVQVTKSQSSSPRVDSGAEETKQQIHRPATAVETEEDVEDKSGEQEKRVEKVDSSVQCDEDLLAQDEAEKPPTSLLLRDSSKADAVRIDAQMPRPKTKSSTMQGKMLYYKRDKRAASPPRMRHRSSREPNSLHKAPVAAIKSELLFPRELPPPLFFQKGPMS